MIDNSTKTEDDLIVISLEHTNMIKRLLGLPQHDGVELPVEVVTEYKKLVRLRNRIGQRVDDRDLPWLIYQTYDDLDPVELDFMDLIKAQKVDRGDLVTVKYQFKDHLAVYDGHRDDKILCTMQDGSGIQREFSPTSVKLAD